MGLRKRVGAAFTVTVVAVASLAFGDPAVAGPKVPHGQPLLTVPDPARLRSAAPPEPPITVAPDPAAGEVSADMLKAMKRDLKVTEAQARARLVRADWASRLTPRLRERLGAVYGGSWMGADGQELVVAITDPSREAFVRASGATPKLVARGEADLSAMGARLDSYARNRKALPEKVAGWVVDPTTNGVRVQILDGGRADAEAFVAAAGLSPHAVGYETIRQRPHLTSDIKGGDAILPARPFELVPLTRCSAAFAVTDSQGRPGYLSVAHCFPFGNEQTLTVNPYNDPPFTHQGVLAGRAFGGTHDEAFVRVQNSERPVPSVRGVRIYDSTFASMADIPVSDGVEQLPGSPICKAGSTTLLTCGKRIVGTFSWGIDGIPGPLVSGLAGATGCAENGDSGGAVISGEHAQGILSASLADCDAINRLSISQIYYVPLRSALTSLNVTLKVRTRPAPPAPPAPSKKWTDGGTAWDGLDGSIVGQPASISLGADQVQVFGRGTDNRLYTNTATEGAWSGWQSPGDADALTGPPTVLARSGGIDVYYRGVDTRPYLRRWNGSAWEAPVKLGDIDVVGTIAAVSAQPGHVILFIRSSDDEVKYNFNDGSGWSGWLGLGGDVNASPTAIARTNAAGQPVLEVYARWADDNVRYRRLDPAGPPGWQQWVNLAGIWKDTPVGVTVGTDQSFLIGWARDDTVHFQRWKNGDWLRGGDGSINTGWRGIGGNAASQPTAVAGPGEQIHVFARDANQQVNMATWPGWNDIYWESWVPLDGATSVPVAAGLRGGGSSTAIDTFGVDTATGQPYYATVGVGPSTPKLTVSTTSLRTGDPAYLTVTGPPGAPVYWSSTQNGAQVENHAFYGQYLDRTGTLIAPIQSNEPGGSVGQWVKQAQIGTLAQRTAEASYTVTTRPLTLVTDKSTYQVGDDITVMVSGPPYSSLLWSSTVNGVTSGETDVYYGQNLLADGVFVGTSKWTDTRTGTWVKQVRAGVQTAQVVLTVTGPPPPPAPALQEKTLTAAASGDDRMHVVGLGTDQHLYAREQYGGASSAWYRLGDGTFSAAPTAVVNTSGQVEVYAVGTDSAVYRNVHNGAGAGGWSGWLYVNACCIKDKLSVTKDKFNRFNVFGLGFDNQVYVSRQTGIGANTWTVWQGLGGTLTKPPSAVGFYWFTFYYTFVFGIGTDGNAYIYNRIEDPDANTRTYGSWGLLGGPVVGLTAVGTPSGTSSTVRPFAVFARSTDNRIYYYNDPSTSWISLGEGSFVGDPVAVGGGSANIFSVLAVGADRQVYFNRQTCFYNPVGCGAVWSGWSVAGPGTVLSEPAAARLSTERLQAFGLDPARQPVINNQAQPHSPSWSGWSTAW